VACQLLKEAFRLKIAKTNHQPTNKILSSLSADQKLRQAGKALGNLGLEVIETEIVAQPRLVLKPF